MARVGRMEPSVTRGDLRSPPPRRNGWAAGRGVERETVPRGDSFWIDAHPLWMENAIAFSPAVGAHAVPARDG